MTRVEGEDRSRLAEAERRQRILSEVSRVLLDYAGPDEIEPLRRIVQPYILRRLKSDPTVVADLPEKVESREFSYLTSEQASMYESCGP